MPHVEVEKKCLCEIPFTPTRGQAGATIWFILRQKGFKVQRVAKLSGHHSFIIFSLLFNSFPSSELTFIVLSSSIGLNMKFFHAVLCRDGKKLLDSLRRVLKYFKEGPSLETFWQHALWPSRPLRPQQPSSWPIIPFAKNKIHVEVYFLCSGTHLKGDFHKCALYMIKWRGSQWNTRGLKGFFWERRCAAFLFRHGQPFWPQSSLLHLRHMISSLGNLKKRNF